MRTRSRTSTVALDIIDAIYASVESPSDWPVVLEMIAAALRASAVVLIHHDYHSVAGSISAAARVDPAVMALYATHYNRIDPWFTSLKARDVARPGHVVVDEMLLPRAALRRTEYYGEFGRPHGLSRLLSTVLAQSDDLASAVSVMRGDGDRAFAPADVALLRRLMPHLRRAMHLHQRLTSHGRGEAFAALDELPFGLVLVDRNGAVSAANQPARTFLAAAQRIALRDGRLTTYDPELDAALRAALALATGRSGAAAARCSVLHIARRDSDAPLEALVVPTGFGAMLPGTPGALIVITDPAARTELDAEALQKLFGLTPVEAAIARDLGAGHTVLEIADQRRMTAGTTRWYVKQILHKVGVRNQAALARRLASSVAALSTADR